MRATVFKDFRLYCSHSVAAFGTEHKCNRNHGHTFRIRVEVTCPVNAHNGIAIPFHEIEDAWEKTGAKLDHTCLNDTLGENATTEFLAMWLKSKLEHELNQTIAITVQETETSGVILT